MAKLPGSLPIGLLLIAGFVGLAIYSINNFSKNGTLFGQKEYRQAELVELLSFGNLYNGQKVCTKGYYVKGNNVSILKVRTDEGKLTRSAWVETFGHEIIPAAGGLGNKFVLTEICGKFESARDGEFGEPPVWISQLTVESFKTFGNVEDLKTPL
mgnify:FL=1